MYTQLVSWDNVYLAYRKQSFQNGHSDGTASRGKRGRPSVAQFEYRLEDNLIRLQTELQAKTYQPGPYHSFYIHEPKRRLISAAPFREMVWRYASGEIALDALTASARGWANHARYGNTAGLRKSLFGGILIPPPTL